MKRATKRALAPVLTLIPSATSILLEKSAQECVVELRSRNKKGKNTSTRSPTIDLDRGVATVVLPM